MVREDLFFQRRVWLCTASGLFGKIFCTDLFSMVILAFVGYPIAAAVM